MSLGDSPERRFHSGRFGSTLGQGGEERATVNYDKVQHWLLRKYPLLGLS